MLDFSKEELAVIGFTFVGFIVVFFAMRSLFSKRDLKKRIGDIGAPERKRSAFAFTGGKNADDKKLFSENQTLKSSPVANYIRTSNRYKSEKYRVTFEQVGWDPANAVVISVIAKLLLGMGMLVVFFGLTLFVAFLSELNFLLRILITILGFFVGMKSFDFLMSFLISSRYAKIKKDLSSALDLLVICTNAGLSVDKGLEQVAREIGKYNTELAKEFAMTSIELNILPDRKLALKNLARRVNIPLIRGLSTTLVQSEEQGTSVSQTLLVLAEEFREKTLLDAETKAARLPALLALPVVLFTLPSLLMVILGPAIIKLLNTRAFF